MLRDHKVCFRREESIESAAFDCRCKAANQNDALFNIVTFIEAVLPAELKRLGKGRLEIKFDVNDGDDPPAYVTHNPPVLHVHPDVWELAKLGEPEARYILAHEVGHL